MSALPPDLRQEDIGAILLSGLPRGPIWRRAVDSVMANVLLGLAKPLADFHARSLVLLERESFPPAAVELLPDWEAAFGLPDECVGVGASSVERQLALISRLTEQGGQSAAYYIAVAAALGYAVTIEEARIFRVDQSTCEDGLYDDTWAYTWFVRASSETVIDFTVDISTCEDPLSSWGNARLECVIRRIAPAHTIVLFAYGD